MRLTLERIDDPPATWRPEIDRLVEFLCGFRQVVLSNFEILEGMPELVDQNPTEEDYGDI